MRRLSSITIGHLKILDHLMLGFAYNSSAQEHLHQKADRVAAIAMGSWSQVKKAFCDGDLHGAFIPLPEALSLFDSGMDIKVLVYDCRPGICLVANPFANIARLRDFKGKTVLLSNYLSVHHILFYRLMASAGLKVGLEADTNTDVYIEIAPPLIISEMLKYDHAGDIAGCFIEEPFGSVVVKECKAKIVLPSFELWTAHPGSVLVLHDYVIKDYRHNVMELINLMAASSRFIFKGSDKLHSLAQNFFDQDADIIEKMFAASLPEKALSIMPDINAFQVINRFMAQDMGIMNNIIDVENLVDRSFALEAGA